jgi:prepilin peptidase CpaA
LARPSDLIVLATIVGGALAAAAIDLRTRRVPNALNALIAIVGLGLAATGVSGVSTGAAAAGLGLGLALMLPGFLFGATGAGDVKLFAAMGTLVGPAPIVRAFVFTAIFGGVMAIAIAASRGMLQRTLGRTATLVASGGANTDVIEAPAENNRFPYAPAIAVGCVIAALGL